MGGLVTRRNLAFAISAWAIVACLLMAVRAPAMIRFPITGTFAMFGVGAAAVLILRIESIPLRFGLIAATGLASLILASEIPLLLVSFDAAASLAIQAVVTVAICFVVVLRERGHVDPPADLAKDGDQG